MTSALRTLRLLAGFIRAGLTTCCARFVNTLLRLLVAAFPLLGVSLLMRDTFTPAAWRARCTRRLRFQSAV